ncbi:MAG: hypothetical protein K1X83_13650 [Oligoflexia bacterium]|nr:hypothetical protein [Oligoflexia bacterium]
MPYLKALQGKSVLSLGQLWDRFWILTFLGAGSAVTVGCCLLLFELAENLLNSRMIAVATLFVEAAVTAIPGVMFLAAATVLLNLASPQPQPAKITQPR